MSEDLERRLAKLEAKVDVQADRMQSGNSRFNSQDQAIAKVASDLEKHAKEQAEREEKRRSSWIGVAFAVAMSAGGWIYSYAQRPDRDEVQSMVRQHSPWQVERGTVLRVVESYDRDRKEFADKLEQITQQLTKIDAKIETRGRPWK